MAALGGLLHRLRVLLRGEEYAREVDEEMRFHMSLDADHHARAGRAPDEARIDARRRFGNPTYLKEEVRYAAGTRSIDALLQDVRYALRSLRRSPGFVVLAIITLALAIGSSTAVFSVVDAVVLRGLPYRDANRLAAIYEVSEDGKVRTPSYPTFADWKTQAQAFSSAVQGLAYVRGDGIKIDDDPERHIAAYVSRGFFDLVGSRAALGRTFLADEEAPGAPSVAVISWPLFMEKYGGDPGVIGKTIRLNGVPATVIGVMPHAFAVPNFGGSLMPAVWQALGPMESTTPQLAMRALHVDSRTIVRLAPGADSGAVAAAMRTVQQRLAGEYPAEQAHWTSVAIESMSSQVYGNRRQQLSMIFGAVALVLLLACVNISNLFLVRANVRSRELAVRAALGASRWRIARQLFAEALAIAFLAGALGILLGAALVGYARHSATQFIPFVKELRVGTRGVVFALAVALLAALIMGALPALRASVGALMLRLKAGGGTAGGDRHDRRLRYALVSVQFALTVVLLIGAGLLLQSFRRVAAVSLGYDANGLIELAIKPPAQYAEPAAAAALYRRLIDRFEARPGVSSATAMGGALIPVPVNRPDVAGETRITATYHPVSAEYLRTVRRPLVSGRWFSDEDMRAASGFVVNEKLARELAQSGSPLGMRITVRRSSQARKDFGQPITLPVIGVIGDARLNGPENAVDAEVLLPYTLEVWPWMQFSVRATAPDQTARLIEKDVRDVDPGIEFFGKPSVSRTGLGAVDQGRRFITLIVAGFALAALLLACVGLYGIVSYGVEQRRRELGVRIALGASSGTLVRFVVREATISLAGGVALGAGGAYASVRIIRGMLFQTDFADPATFASVLVVLAGVTLVASYAPAVRATNTDPMLAIRSD
ncbi:MAG TPA: ADOP family duplicated permease [Gemmatimonadaceae bacterium]|nr:ADOP family duplicated permease [Gemmatimonadaceae bacterium]